MATTSISAPVLKKNSLSIVGSVAMCMAFMGPATSVAFNTEPAAAGAGFALPLDRARAHRLSAGREHDCNVRAQTASLWVRLHLQHPRIRSWRRILVGSGWLLLLNYGMLGPMLLAAIGSFSSQFISDQFHAHVAWQIMSLVFGATVWAINAAGVSELAKTALVFLVIEVGVMLGLATTILGKGGDHGHTGRLQPGPFFARHLRTRHRNIVGNSQVYRLRIRRDPRRGSQIRYPHDPHGPVRRRHLHRFVLPVPLLRRRDRLRREPRQTFAVDGSLWTTLASHYWGITWALTLTVLASQFANFISGTNAVVRVVFSMGREGILPRRSRTHRQPASPHRRAQRLPAAVYRMRPIARPALRPARVYGFCGTLLGLGMIVIYILISIAVIRFYRREHPSEFSLFRLGVLPVLTALIMLIPVYGQIRPVPAYPNNLVPYILVAWMLVGAAYLAFLRAKRPALIEAMGRVFEDAPEAAPEPHSPAAHV